MSEPKKDEITKKRFIVRRVDVKISKTMERYADELERTLNSMHEDGYEPQIMGDPEEGKVLLLGVLRPGQTHASVIFDMLGGGSSPHLHKHKSAKTTEVLEFLYNLNERIDASFDLFEKSANDAADITIKRIGANEAPLVAGDLEDIARAHNEKHPDSSDCEIPKILELFAKKLRERVQVNVQ